MKEPKMRLRMRLACGVATAVGLVLCGDVGAQTETLVFGFGTHSCATWVSQPADEIEGRAWILAFWSGMNAMGGNDGRLVGHSTDVEGIIGEVRKYCGERPSAQLWSAVVVVHLKMDFDEMPNDASRTPHQ
jgi:hypothetical protein